MARSPSTPPDPRLRDLLGRDHSLRGAVLFGLDGHPIELQARAVEVLQRPASWKAATTVTGMAKREVIEAIDRIAGAFAKYSIPQPRVRIVVNLAPADLPKEGTWLDLPLAVILLQAAGLLPDLPGHEEQQYILMGELGLHGEVRRVPGALSMACGAKPGQTLVVPSGNERECALVTANPAYKGCKVASVATLEDVVRFFKGERRLEDVRSRKLSFDPVIPRAIDFGRIRGQERAKDAALIAAAGGHNLLLSGPPGEGKSLLASAIPGILPGLSDAEIVEVTRIYSACGQLTGDGLAVTRRPFRPVHHTASKQALVGGGSGVPRPGEVTLAHLGVLFLDELAEFSRATLDALRQPIENGEVSVSRTGGTLTFPCRFMLIAAMNPCPCGFHGTDRCRCDATEIRRYQGRISGPIVDRIDLQVDMGPLSTEERFADAGAEVSPALRARVDAARERQRERLAPWGAACNAAIPGGHVREACAFAPEGFERFRAAADARSLTTRTVDRLAKVARTVADLAESGPILPAHVETALGFVTGGVLRAGPR